MNLQHTNNININIFFLKTYLFFSISLSTMNRILLCSSIYCTLLICMIILCGQNKCPILSTQCFAIQIILKLISILTCTTSILNHGLTSRWVKIFDRICASLSFVCFMLWSPTQVICGISGFLYIYSKLLMSKNFHKFATYIHCISHLLGVLTIYYTF